MLNPTLIENDTHTYIWHPLESSILWSSCMYVYPLKLSIDQKTWTISLRPSTLPQWYHSFSSMNVQQIEKNKHGVKFEPITSQVSQYRLVFCSSLFFHIFINMNNVPHMHEPSAWLSLDQGLWISLLQRKKIIIDHAYFCGIDPLVC